jgi:hypothetical protein
MGQNPVKKAYLLLSDRVLRPSDRQSTIPSVNALTSESWPLVSYLGGNAGPIARATSGGDLYLEIVCCGAPPGHNIAVLFNNIPNPQRPPLPAAGQISAEGWWVLDLGHEAHAGFRPVHRFGVRKLKNPGCWKSPRTNPKGLLQSLFPPHPAASSPDRFSASQVAATRHHARSSRTDGVLTGQEVGEEASSHLATTERITLDLHAFGDTIATIV